MRLEAARFPAGSFWLFGDFWGQIWGHSLTLTFVFVDSSFGRVMLDRAIGALCRVKFGPYEMNWLQPGDVLRARLRSELKEFVGPGWDWG